VAAEALEAGDVSAARLSGYKERLAESFVLKDMKTNRKAVELMHNDRLFTAYPEIVNSLMQGLYRADGRPKRRIAALGREVLSGRLPYRQLLGDLVRIGRAHL
jgi:electron transfer flavoprotein-quinone oxidoreductase